MPPWPASPHGVALLNSKRLDQATIDAIVQWSKAGGPLDVPATTKIRPKGGPQVPAPRRDVVLRMPQAYAGRLSVRERLPVLRARSALHQAHVHHRLPGDAGQARRDPPRPDLPHRLVAGRPRAAKISGTDGKPGWSCYGTVDLPSTQAPRRRRHTAYPGFTGQAGLIAGWVPGQDPVDVPRALGILMQPGDALVLQMHYHYDTTPMPDRSTVSIQIDPGTDELQDDRHHQPDRAGGDPVHAGQASRRCATATPRWPSDARLYGGIGAGAEGGAARAVRQDVGGARRELQERCRVDLRATTRSPSRARSCRCSATSTRWARRSASRSIPTRRTRRYCSTSRRGTSTGR